MHQGQARRAGAWAGGSGARGSKFGNKDLDRRMGVAAVSYPRRRMSDGPDMARSVLGDGYGGDSVDLMLSTRLVPVAPVGAFLVHSSQKPNVLAESTL